jgi:methyl-accepting chemotaxis protein
VRIRIAAAINLVGVVVFVGLLASAGASFYALQQLRVGGPLYDRIVLGKDLVADILPPPAYVIEAYLVAQLAIDSPGAIGEAKSRLAQLHKEYDQRRAFWATSSLPPALKAEIVEASHAEVTRFWAEVENTFVPAVERGDMEVAHASLARVAQAYSAHRVVVDRMVVAANEMNAATEAEAAREQSLLMGLAGIMALVSAGVLLAGLWAARTGLVTPVGRMTQVMTRLARGEDGIETPFKSRQDEIGEMAQAVEVFRQAGAEREQFRAREAAERGRADQTRDQAMLEREAAEQQRDHVMSALAGGLEKLASGDLAVRLNRAFPSEFEKLRGDFNRAVEELGRTLSVISGSTGDVRVGASNISQAVDSLAHRTEQQASALEETAAALDQITVTVRQTAEGADVARQAVFEATEVASQSGDVVTQAVGAMGRIEGSSREISQIIGVIDEIAFQTNLLALNAGVEAARAGDSGKGFAVVASEVRALAQRSADAARQIKLLISASDNEVKTGVALVSSAGEALKLISGKISEVNDLVGAMAASAHEQATGLGQVNSAVNEMDRVVQQNAAMVQETTSATHGLVGQAEELAQLIGRFRLEAETTVYRAA